MEVKPVAELSSKYDLYKPKGSEDPVAKNGHTEFFYPINAIDPSNPGPINFLVRGTSDYIDLGNSYLIIHGKFVGSHVLTAGNDATPVTTKTLEFGPVNLLPHALFKSVDVSLNGTSINLADQNYAYRAYLQTIFNNSRDTLNTFGALAGWSKDVPEHMDSCKLDENTALAKRRSRESNTGEITFIIQIVSSIFQIDEVLPSKLDLEVTLHKNPNKQFYLMSSYANANFDFHITQAIFKVRKTTVGPDYALGIEKMLSENHPIELTLDDPRIVTFQIQKDTTKFSRDHVTFGHMPRRIVVGLVDTAAFNGSCTKNPFNFQHFNISKISLLKDGLEYPTPPLIMDFDKEKFAEAYHHLISALHVNNTPFIPSIEESDLKNGYFLVVFEMSPDQYGGDHPQMLINDNTNIHLSIDFAEGLKESVTAIVYYQQDMKMSINEFRQVAIESN